MPVLARRIVVVSPDEALGLKLETALEAVADTVELHRTVDSIVTPAAALCVIHIDGELAPSELLPRLTGLGPVIAVLPRSNLAAVVELMMPSDRIVGMMVAEQLDLRRLAAMATRIVADDLFGLDKVMAPKTEIHTRVVGTHDDKSRCMAEVSGFVEQIGAPKKYREPLEQCIDEMVMNALYDAPVDAQGKHIFSGVPTKKRITQRTKQSVVVQYACDGKQVAVSVRDAFGSLGRDTVLAHLHKGLHSVEQVDRKAGGAGLGLYLMVNLSTAVYFNVLPGIATEAVCVFDLETPQVALEQFGFFVQSDARGRRPTGPARRLPAIPHHTRVIPVLAVILAVIGGAWPPSAASKQAQITVRTIPKGATIELEGRTIGTATDGTLAIGELEVGSTYRVAAHLDHHEPKQIVLRTHAGPNPVRFELAALATVELDSTPTGATVEIDGKRVGSTPVTLTSLAPGATKAIVFTRAGYQSATASLEIPRAGEVKRLVQPLELSPDLVRVHFVSNPPGAAVIETGKPATVDRTYTPADVFVEANQVHRFTLTMAKHAPLVIEPFTPSRGETLEKGGDLVEK
ncbi:MAG: hypothetical protein JWO36_1257 [Myxococcales bacterium]|nr:hypothetical protein [Myxococcales bacterium]